MKKNFKNIIILSIIFVCFLVFFALKHSMFSNFEDNLTNFKIRFSTENGVFGKTFSPSEKNIVIINVDDISQYELSRISPEKYSLWPWNRKIWSDIINYLEKAEPKVIVLDEIFSGYEDNSLGISSNDVIFANTLNKYNNIVLATKLDTKLGNNYLQNDYSFEENPFIPVYKPLNIISTDSNIEKNITYLSYSQIPDLFVRNTDIAANNIDNSGEILKYFQPLYKVINDTQTYYIPSAALAGAIKFLNNDSEIILQKNKLTFGKYEIPLNKEGQTLINWHSDLYQYDTIPLNAIINAINTNSGLLKFNEKTLPISALKGKAIIISDTIRNKNLKKTPMSANVSTAQINAAIMDNIINDADTTNITRRKFLKQTPDWANILITIFIFCIVILTGIKAQNGFVYFTLTLIISAFYLGLCALTFFYPDYRTNLPVIMPIYFVIAAYTITNVYKILNNIKKYAQITNLYGNYISKDTISKFMQTTNLQLGKTVTKDITVMICDIKNFSQYSDKYESQMLLTKLNELFTLITEEIYANNGIIYKIIEDSVIAYWGAPITTQDDAYNAVKCALSIYLKLDKNKIMLDEENYLDINIAINTGNCMIGCIETNNISEYNLIGNGLNYAKKIEKICSMTEKSLLISESTYNETKMKIQSNYKGEMKIKDSDKKIKIYEPVGIIK